MNNKIQADFNIQVETLYLKSESEPDNSRYVFAYTITIENRGDRPAQLLTRHWTITDANGRIQEVNGEGVVGKQPLIKPGEGFQYTSGALLETPVGIMEGSYQFVTDDGENISTPIQPFTLSIPRTLH